MTWEHKRGVPREATEGVQRARKKNEGGGGEKERGKQSPPACAPPTARGKKRRGMYSIDLDDLVKPHFKPENPALKPVKPHSKRKAKKTTVMSGTSGAVRESEVWCYTKEEDVVESAVRAVRGSVRSAAASHEGASVLVWAKADTETAMQKLSEDLDIEILPITDQQEADVYVEMRVGTGVVAAWWVHVDRTEHVASAGTEEPATVEEELKAAKKVIEKLHEEVKEAVDIVKEKEEEFAKLRAEKAELEAGLVRCGDTELMAAELEEMGLSVEWADRNLDVWKMSDGVKVVEAEKKEEWGLFTKKGVSVWCHYEGDKESCKKWGKMYSMGNVKELEKLAPQGWRIPTGGEWRELLEAHGLRFDDDGITIVSDEQEVKAVVEALLDGPFKGAGNGGCRDEQGRFDGMAMWWVMTGGRYGLEYVIVVQQQDTMGMGDILPSGLGYYVRCVRDKLLTQ